MLPAFGARPYREAHTRNVMQFAFFVDDSDTTRASLCLQCNNPYNAKLPRCAWVVKFCAFSSFGDARGGRGQVEWGVW